jgi:hypothetical protein
MFISPAVPFLLSKATLRIDKNDEGDRVRVADLALQLEPLPYELAAELEDALTSHLFTADRQIRPELEDVTLNPRAPLQRITVSSAKDAPSIATITAARILDLAITKRRDEKSGRAWLRAILNVRIDLAERSIREFLFHHFGEVRCFTFMAEQHTLPMGDTREAVRDLQRLAGRDSGSVEIAGPDGEGVRITKDDVQPISNKKRAH